MNIFKLLEKLYDIWEKIKSFFGLLFFLLCVLMFGYSSYDLFKTGEILYGFILGFLTLFSIGIVWVIASDLKGDDKEKDKDKSA